MNKKKLDKFLEKIEKKIEKKTFKGSKKKSKHKQILKTSKTSYTMPNRQIGNIFNDEYYCTFCYKISIKACAICGELMKKGIHNAYYFNSDYYCEDCFDEHFTYCSECNDVISRTEEYYDEYSESSLCRDCYSNRSNRQQYFDPKRIDLNNVTYKHLRYKRCFGIELEINAHIVVND